MNHWLFLLYLGIFLLAGFIGRYRFWFALVPSAIIPPIMLTISGESLLSIIGSVFIGLIAGGAGAVIIPIIWKGIHSPGGGIRFVNSGAPSRTTLNFNWVKDDNESSRKRWTEHRKD